MHTITSKQVCDKLLFILYILVESMTEPVLDASAAKNLFERSGTSVAEWARIRGFSAGLVYQVLEGRRKCMRGQSHKIALALGLKRGVALGIDELSRQLVEQLTVLDSEK